MSRLDITSTAVEKGLDMVKGFLEKLAGSSIEEAGLMWADTVRLRRLKNQIKILEKAKKIAEDGNIDIKQINLKVLVPLLEYSSLEEEETLQDKWANLISNYADSNQVYESSIFPYILSQLAANEILVLEDLFKTENFSTADLNNVNRNNLVRLGIIEKSLPSAIVKNIKVSGYGEIEFDKNDNYNVTDLGKEFVLCCNPTLR